LKRFLTSRWTLLVAGLLAYELVHQGAHVLEHLGHDEAQDAVGSAAPMSPLTVDPAWILEGSPTFSSTVFAEAPDGKSVSGVWECVGPTRFRWRFDIDETVYLHEGLINVEYLGERFTLRPGDRAHFNAGTTAVWHVPERARKSFTLREPGRLVRWARRLRQ
jgi:uncharacterized cupin superfamily protein